MKERKERRWLAMGMVLLCLALQRPASLLSNMLFPAAQTSAVAACLSALLREMVLMGLPALALLPWRTRRLGVKDDLRWIALLALPVGVMVQLWALGLRSWLPWLSSASLPVPGTAGEWALAVLALAVVPAVLEEAFFRGGVLGYLRDATSPVWAFVLTTLLFALLHGSLGGLPAHLAVSACCTLCAMNTGRVWPPMLLHLGYNLAALLSLWLPASAGWMALGVIPVLAAALLAWRTRWVSRERHMTRLEKALTGVTLVCAVLRYLPLGL